MKVTSKKISDTNFEFKVVLDAKDLEPARKEALKTLAKEINVEGFRKGKVPAEIAEKFIPENDLNRETADIAVRSTVIPALMKDHKNPLALPSIEVTKYVPGEVLEYTAKAEILPDFKLADWKNLGVKKKEAKVSEKDINQILENLSNSFAEKKVVRRAAKKSDEVIIDFTGKKDGVAFEGGSAKDFRLTLGSGQFIPGFEEGIEGHESGDKFNLDITFPKDYGAKDLAGQPVVFEILVKQVNEITPAKIDDELAKKCGPFKTLDELKEDIKKNITAQTAVGAENQYRDDLVRELSKKSKVPAPDILVKDQLALIRNDAENNAKSAGLSFDDYLARRGVSQEDWEKQARDLAAERVKASLALQALAEEENLSATDEEVSANIAKLREVYKKSPEALKNLKNPRVKNEIRNRIVIEKALSLLSSENEKSAQKAKNDKKSK